MTPLVLFDISRFLYVYALLSKQLSVHVMIILRYILSGTLTYTSFLSDYGIFFGERFNHWSCESVVFEVLRENYPRMTGEKQ